MADGTIADLSGSGDFPGLGGTSSSSSPFDFGAALGGLGSLTGAAGGFVASQATAAGDKAAAEGFTDEATAYSKAAGYATGNVSLEEEATKIQQYQQQRQVNAVVGQQKAVEGASGLTGGGSGLYLLRSSLAQGALGKGLIGVQGAINAAGYAQQAASDTGLSQQATANASAATAAASSAQTGGILGVLGGILGAGAKLLPMIPGL